MESLTPSSLVVFARWKRQRARPRGRAASDVPTRGCHKPPPRATTVSLTHVYEYDFARKSTPGEHIRPGRSPDRGSAGPDPFVRGPVGPPGADPADAGGGLPMSTVTPADGRKYPRHEVGDPVMACDRDPPNFGTVVADRGPEVTVHFVSPRGYTADPTIPKSKPKNPDGTPLGSKPKGRGPRPGRRGAAPVKDQAGQRGRLDDLASARLALSAVAGREVPGGPALPA